MKKFCYNIFGLLDPASFSAPPSSQSPPPIWTLTSGSVRDDGHSEVDLPWMDVRGGADGVVAWLEQWQLSEQQGARHLNGGELLQHLHQGWVVEPLPLLVLLQAL